MGRPEAHRVGHRSGGAPGQRAQRGALEWRPGPGRRGTVAPGGPRSRRPVPPGVAARDRRGHALRGVGGAGGAGGRGAGPAERRPPAVVGAGGGGGPRGGLERRRVGLGPADGRLRPQRAAGRNGRRDGGGAHGVTPHGYGCPDGANGTGGGVLLVGDQTEWLGTKEASARLGITLRSLYRFIDEGDLAAYKFGRVIRMKVEDVDRFIESCRIQPGQLEHLYPPLKVSDTD